MQLLTTVKVKTVFNSNEAEFTAKCQSINASYDFKIEYDGRDALIRFPSYYQIELTEWCQLVLGLFSKQSNFKRVLFKTFSFLKCNKKLEYIFFNVNGITISVQQDSDPYELMRDYYRNSHYVVLDNDTEQEIKERNKKLLKLQTFIYRIFLQEEDNSTSKSEHAFFFTKEEESIYGTKKSQNLNKKFKEFLSTFELDPDSSEESKELLSMLKKNLLH